MKLEETQIPNDKNYLLTVSGGVDSMVLASLFKSQNLKFSIAHCNFGLRGEESDGDEKLVKEWAKLNEIKIHTNKFNTSSYSKTNGISTQMAARELRYSWFQELLSSHNYDHIVTAHHLDDQIETFFINLSRGTGVKGLTGMKEYHNNIYRPLLCFSKQEIETFAQNNKVNFRNDSSNESNYYKRNSIRNEIIPIFKKLNPNFAQTMSENLKILQSTESIYQESIDQTINELISTKKGLTYFNKNELLKLIHHKTILFEFLYPFGFNINQVEDMLKSVKNTGKLFISKTHKCLIDREFIIVKKIEKESNTLISLKKESQTVTIYNQITLEVIGKNDVNLNQNSNVALLDYDKIGEEIIIRNWKNGDYFFPVGMKGRKKLSDYFTDIKLNRFEKEEVFVLETHENIAWVVNHRIDNRYKIEESTEKILRITFKN